MKEPGHGISRARVGEVVAYGRSSAAAGRVAASAAVLPAVRNIDTAFCGMPAIPSSRSCSVKGRFAWGPTRKAERPKCLRATTSAPGMANWPKVEYSMAYGPQTPFLEPDDPLLAVPLALVLLAAGGRYAAFVARGGGTLVEA